ncbi:hypothetical protein [Thioalkalivibrio thiocyanodenitrificans]|uniref:hypothetical protein n=1 Tax=Thioalkalivibrio thiocyanodenitrificans TaxID=243063 RepID=UPI000375C7E0|nr:hypothetical protein [Thioalkalivibrio thiocyanodenitrificans]
MSEINQSKQPDPQPRGFPVAPETSAWAQELRQAMLDVARMRNVPSRFLVDETESAHYVSITDTHTSRMTRVPIEAYSSVRKCLQDLFPAGS